MTTPLLLHMICGLALVGCGRIGFSNQSDDDGGSPDNDGGEALIDGGGDIDATEFGVDPWDGPFTLTQPIHLPDLSSAEADRNCAFNNTGLTLFISSTRTLSIGGNDIFQSKRTSLGEDFGQATHVPGLSTTAEDGRFQQVEPRIGFLFSGKSGTLGGADIWQVTRSATTEDWLIASAIGVPGINSSDQEYDPWVSPSGLAIYFVSTRGGDAGDQDLYVARRGSTGEAFGQPTALSELNTTGNDESPTLSADELFIVFVRPNGGDGKDLFYARRSNTSESFGGIQAVPVVNSASDDSEPCLGLNGELYFSSERNGGLGGLDLYKTRFVAN